MKIRNLYRPEASREILGRKEVYALEKIHGTSAHIKYNLKDGISFFSGGIKHTTFVKMLDERFDMAKILHVLSAITKFNTVNEITVFGEAYGGKCQRMTNVYGSLNFIAFEVKLDDKWIDVTMANAMVKDMGLEFVHFEKGPGTVEWLNAQRDKPSEQAKRNGMGEHFGEGIVIRPLREELCHRGNRIMAKHKREVFGETKTPREIDPDKQRVWTEARETAEEWVTEQRLEHVLDKLKASGCDSLGMRQTGAVIRAMIADVKVESGVESGVNPEIEWTATVSKAIGSEAALLYKKWVTSV